eukprot:CAMPEP_0181487252 /NCGR_PEP_ID=MMETSP1110-20121109/47703_1 /TAXON_ID=174948 /ORGANISM="Symbiodinium sp., Strain CCMP421" /LENGTH=74 /DNA_ID=CAMNT_0023613713 /DNA_START=21 /DNA_END=245 /DNA_ORIENTATION=-
MEGKPSPAFVTVASGPGQGCFVVSQLQASLDSRSGAASYSQMQAILGMKGLITDRSAVPGKIETAVDAEPASTQ